MNYNYITSIFLLLFSIVLSQTLYVYMKNPQKPKTVEGLSFFKKLKRGFQKSWVGKTLHDATHNKFVDKIGYTFDKKAYRRHLADLARKRYLKLLNQFVNKKNSKYANILGQMYVSSKTAETLKAYNEVIEVDQMASRIDAAKSDKDMEDIIKKTSTILNGPSLNSTKVYFLSAFVLKGFAPFYGYNIRNIENHYNYLREMYPATFRDNESVKNKYIHFITLLSLGQVATTVTSTSLDPNGTYFATIAQPIINEAKKVVDVMSHISYV